jgi:hypothetical protein
MTFFTARRGTAMLISILFVALLLILMKPFVRTSTLLLDLASVRIRHMEQYYATQAFLWWGSHLVKNNWKELMRQTAPQTIDCKTWPLSANRTVYAQMSIEPHQENILIKAKTKPTGNSSYLVMSARVHYRPIQDTFYVTDIAWAHE